MPQIWLSYPELAAFLGCAAEDARPVAIGREWSRRRCRDGLTRVKLTPADAERYMLSCVEASTRIDRQVDALRAILDEARREPSAPARSASGGPGAAAPRTLRAG